MGKEEAETIIDTVGTTENLSEDTAEVADDVPITAVDVGVGIGAAVVRT